MSVIITKCRYQPFSPVGFGGSNDIVVTGGVVSLFSRNRKLDFHRCFSYKECSVHSILPTKGVEVTPIKMIIPIVNIFFNVYVLPHYNINTNMIFKFFLLIVLNITFVSIDKKKITIFISTFFI